MGDYTGLRFEVPLNPLGISLIHRLEHWNNHRGMTINTEAGRISPWANVAQEFSNLPWVREWADVGRCNFIPYGALSYMAEDWVKEANLKETLGPHTDGAWGRERAVGYRWKVCCSLKNYEGEIEHFLRRVMPHLIAEKVTVETLFEYDNEPTIWNIAPVDMTLGDFGRDDLPEENEGPSRWEVVAKLTKPIQKT
jgi:hypothetical protein